MVCYNPAALQENRSGGCCRSLKPLKSGPGQWERKVRTLQGSEPANGGAFDCDSLNIERRQVQQRKDQPRNSGIPAIAR